MYQPKKKNEKLLQHCATRIHAVFRPFLVDSSINLKTYYIYFLNKQTHEQIRLWDLFRYIKQGYF